ncbi:hypothetical protein BGZ68_005257 [Mortierella alpina]|nr:hypothetical protein BGZ68_005257 [Mortierella alpina]
MSPFSRLAIVATILASALVCAAPVDSGHPIQKRAAATVIARCTVPGTIALTFDDGPFVYTNGLLDILRSRAVKATFFMNGNAYGRIEDFAAVVKRAYDDGHQIASHTWDHKDLTSLNQTEVLSEMTLLEDAFKKIIGVRPTYVRPPFGSLNSQVLEVLGERDYTAVTWDTDTQDWAHPDNFEASFKVYETILNNSDEINQPGHIVLQHEVNQVTALQVAPMAIDLALVRGFKVVTVGECLGDPKIAEDVSLVASAAGSLAAITMDPSAVVAGVKSSTAAALHGTILASATAAAAATAVATTVSWIVTEDVAFDASAGGSLAAIAVDPSAVVAGVKSSTAAALHGTVLANAAAAAAIVFIIAEDLAFEASAAGSLAAITVDPSAVIAGVEASTAAALHGTVFAAAARGDGQNQGEEGGEEEDSELSLHLDCFKQKERKKCTCQRPRRYYYKIFATMCN